MIFVTVYLVATATNAVPTVSFANDYATIAVATTTSSNFNSLSSKIFKQMA